MEQEKVFKMKFSKIYPLLLAKVERKGRFKSELDDVIYWLCGYDEEAIAKQLQADVSYQQFFENAPCINPNIDEIKGTICRVKIQEIQDPLMRKIRVLDKLVDDLAKGKSLDKILK